MTSTTLMTFLLCAPPSTRSVELLGSWDNFSRPYAMERDKRVGSGHWRGCHTFADIVCDGPPNKISPGRTGGLKMGGTYWYYYLLDDDVEFYNDAEPVTTLCPFLPGQPVNVLHVPIILPDSRTNHSRESSISSQKSNYRTMNPEDKFLNPRQPPKPQPARLRTSPPLLQLPNPSWSFNSSPLGVITNRSTSQPNSATVNSESRGGREVKALKAARSVSPPRSRGLRAAFRYFNASCPDIDATNHQDETVAKPVEGYGIALPETGTSRGDWSSVSRPGTGCQHRERASFSAQVTDSYGKDQLLLRQPGFSPSDESTPLSIQTRRVQKASEDRAPLRQFLTLEMQSGSDKPDHDIHPTTTRCLETVEEAVSQGSSPLALATAKMSAVSQDTVTPRPFIFKNKRLPTLPNTPSSVMDEALRDIHAQDEELDAEVLYSHFSDFTTTDESVVDTSECERSHFSEWSVDVEAISPESMTSSSTFNNDQPMTEDLLDSPDLLKPTLADDDIGPDTPHITVDSRPPSPTSVAGDSPPLFLSLPRLTISLSPSDLDIPGLCIDDLEGVQSNPKRHAALFDAMETMNGLGLSRTPDASTAMFPDDFKQGLSSPRYANTVDKSRNRLSDAHLGQSAAMQELMDELSYLKNMIEAGADDI